MKFPKMLAYLQVIKNSLGSVGLNFAEVKQFAKYTICMHYYQAFIQDKGKLGAAKKH